MMSGEAPIADYDKELFKVTFTACHWGIKTEVSIMEDGRDKVTFQELLGTIEQGKLSLLQEQMKNNRKATKKKNQTSQQ